MRKCYFFFAMLLMSIAMTVKAQEPTVTVWDGKALQVTIKSGETQTFSYTAEDRGTLYILSNNQSEYTSVRVAMQGGVWVDGAYEEDYIIEDTEEGYENGLGVYGKISVIEDTEIRFTITGSVNEENPNATTSFTLKSMFFKNNVGGSSWENPIQLELNQSTSLPVYKNYQDDMFPDYRDLTFVRFVAPSDGVACIVVPIYKILYMQEDLFDGSAPFASCTETTNANEHEFAVKKGCAYLVALPISRPETVLFKMNSDRVGGTCNYPTELTAIPANLSLVKGHNWFKMDVSELGTKQIMDLSVSEGWQGTITYMENCLYAQEVLGNDNVTGTAATFHKNLDPQNTGNDDYLYIDIVLNDQEQVENAASITLREPQESETCTMAVPVQAGEKAFEGEARDYWFVYTSDKDVNIQLSAKNAIRYVSNGCGRSNSLSPNQKYRAYADTPIYICVNMSQAGKDTLNITEEEIVAGTYCDYPLDFKLGDPIAIKDRIITGEDMTTTYLRFQAEKSGFAYIETTNVNWTENYWTVTVKNDCSGWSLPVDRYEDEDPVTGDLLIRYKIAVTANETYIFSLTAGANGGKDILATSRFEEPETGSICENPFLITTLGENIAINSEANTISWFSYTADKSGFYTIRTCVRGTCSVKTGDCTAKETYLRTDNSYNNAYMRGYSIAKIFVEEGTPFFIYTKSNNAPYSDEDPFFVNVTFSEARPGEAFSGAIEAQEGIKYDVPSGADAFDTWYVYTIPAHQEQIIEIGSDVMNYANLTFYADENTTLFSYKKDFTMETVFNANNQMCGKKYTFAEAETDRVIYILASVQNNPIWWTIHKSVPVGVEHVGAQNTLTVSPNPNNGIFSVSVPALEAGASVSVQTLAGAEVYSAPLTATTTTVNLSGRLNAGIYLVTVTNGTTVTGKMIIK